MKPLDKALFALGAWVFFTIGITNPFNWDDEAGNPVVVTPAHWIVYGILSFVLFRVAYKGYKEWAYSRPKRTFVPNSRSHYKTNKRK